MSHVARGVPVPPWARLTLNGLSRRGHSQRSEAGPAPAALRGQAVCLGSAARRAALHAGPSWGSRGQAADERQVHAGRSPPGPCIPAIRGRQACVHGSAQRPPFRGRAPARDTCQGTRPQGLHRWALCARYRNDREGLRVAGPARRLRPSPSAAGCAHGDVPMAGRGTAASPRAPAALCSSSLSQALHRTRRPVLWGVLCTRGGVLGSPAGLLQYVLRLAGRYLGCPRAVTSPSGTAPPAASVVPGPTTPPNKRV